MNKTIQDTLGDILIGSPDPRVFFVTGKEAATDKVFVRLFIDDDRQFAHEYFVRDVVDNEDLADAQEGEDFLLKDIKVTESEISLSDISSFVRRYNDIITDPSDIKKRTSECILFLSENQQDIIRFVEKQSDGDYAWAFAGDMFLKSRFDFPSTSWDCDDSELTKRLSAAALKHYPGTKE